MGAPYLPDTATISLHHRPINPCAASCHQSRPGVGVVDQEGVSQAAPLGKYTFSLFCSRSDARPLFSAHPDSTDSAITSSLHAFRSSPATLHSSPGRIMESLMRAPHLPDTAPSWSNHRSQNTSGCCHQSRPGAVVSFRGGVSQPAPLGKYYQSFCRPVPDARSTFSNTSSSNLPTTSAAPGRVYHGLMEDPGPPATVEPTCLHIVSSRPGPVCSVRNGVFQSAFSGKYTFCSKLSPLPSNCSTISSTPRANASDAGTLSTPGHQPARGSLKVYYQNVRGLRTKTNEVLLALGSCDYDVVIFSETWLVSAILNSEFAAGYDIFRCDRSMETSSLIRGGGVLVAVKAGQNCKKVELVGCESLEQIAVRIILPHQSLFVCCIYIRPTSNTTTYSLHSCAVQQILELADVRDLVLVVGDYNLPALAWFNDDDTNSFLPANASTDQEIMLMETMLSAGLVQINNLVNARGTLLDLAFVSDSSATELLEPPCALLKLDAHHKPFIIKLDFDLGDDAGPDELEEVLDFSQCDFDLLNEKLFATDWETLLNARSVNEAAQKFYGQLNSIFGEVVPKKVRRTNRRYKLPWWNDELRTLRNRLRKATSRYIDSRTAWDKVMVQNIEDEYNALNQASFQSYISSTQRNLKRDPSKFWNYVNSRKNAKRTPTDVSYRNVDSTSPSDSANFFADFFKSVHSSDVIPPRENEFEHVPRSNLSLPLPVLSDDEILKALSDVDTSKGPGPDGVPPSVIKSCASSLTAPIKAIFNESLQTAVFPEVWKIASITPIHKSGSNKKVENYRPISILNCLAKVFEKIVYDKLYAVVRPIISGNQHGFMRKRSTTTNLLTFVHPTVNALESGEQIDAIFIDFEKAFDKVPHSLTVRKLRKLGLPDWITAWLFSYLTNRKAFVNLRIARSVTFDIPSGVPQGSHLGPLIFILFVNEICSLTGASTLMYADDLKLYRKVKNHVDCCALQTDVDALLHWCDLNGMKVHVKKCKVISFSRSRNPLQFDYKMNGCSLDRVTSIKDLGVTMDTKMRFNEHIALTVAKAFSMLGFLKRNTAHFDDPFALKVLYVSLVRSVLEYAAVIWAPYHVTQIARIERIQRVFVRFALRKLPWNNPQILPSYEARCLLFRIQPLAERRTMLQRLFVFDLLRGNIDCSSIRENVRRNEPSYLGLRRDRPLLWIPRHLFDYGHYNPLDVCCRKFNEVCSSFDDVVTKSVFKARIS